MSIMTERRVTTGQTERTRATVRTQPTLERRRHVFADSPQGRAGNNNATCAGETADAERISWLGVALGVIATAAVMLAFVAVANLRAEPMASPQQSASQVETAFAEQGTILESVLEGPQVAASAGVGR